MILYDKWDVIFNIMKVSPLQRMRVRHLLDAVSDLDFRIYCFGSSVKGTCTPFSDLDLCIETREYSEEEYLRLCSILRRAYYRDYLQNNEMDIIYFNALKESSIFRKAALDGVVLKDFKEV